MNTFEDGAINDDVNDDFELEITDLPASDEESRIPAAIAALRSRISFSAHSEEPGSEVVDDDFELEITDLPTTSADEDHRGRRIETRSVSSVLRLEAPTADVSARDRLITNLHFRFPQKAHMLRLVTVGIAILFMLGVVWESVPSAREAVLGLFPRPTQTPTPVTQTREFGRFRNSFSEVIVLGGDISISSTPIAGTTVVPWNPNTPVSDVLNPAPRECPFANVPQDPDSTDPPYGNPVGRAPLWVMGFQGAPTQLTGFTRANPPQYGWVRQVTLMLEDNAGGPVMLQGAHLLDGTPILFSDPDSGQGPTTFLTLSLDNSSISDADNGVIGGIATISLYIPAAGCYYLKANWAGGSWEVLFGAGQ